MCVFQKEKKKLSLKSQTSEWLIESSWNSVHLQGGTLPLFVCDLKILFKNISSYTKDIHYTAMNMSQPIIKAFVSDTIFSNHDQNWLLLMYQEDGNDVYAQIT